MIIQKPTEEEYPVYTKPYIDLISNDGEVLQHLQNHYDELKTLIEPLDEEQLDYRYAEGKWNIKEILLHLADSERIFTVRALRIARGEQANLTGYDQDDYVFHSDAGSRTITSIFDGFDTVRAATLSLFRSFDKQQLKCVGTADGSPVSVGALIYIIAGHQKHHMNTIWEKYL